MKKILRALAGVAALVMMACTPKTENSKTLGIGVYPGRPDQNFSPVVKPGDDSYRNIALFRAAKHSSSFDYNQTAQLLTDGLYSEEPSVSLEVLQDGEPLSRIQSTYLTDMNHSGILLMGNSTVELVFHGYVSEADELLLAANGELTGVRAKVEGKRADGGWENIGQAKAVPTKDFKGENDLILHMWEFSLPLKASYPAYRFRFEGAKGLMFNEVFFYQGGKAVDVMPGGHFTSSWKSQGAQSEWALIDLGSESRFDKMRFGWINPARKAVVQCSKDGVEWADVAEFQGPEEELLFPEAKGRYVRLCLEDSEDGQPFELSEWEVYGRGGVKVEPKPAPARKGQRQYLSGGHWELCRASDTLHWLPATVPGTVLGTYVDNGAVLHPNFADNQLFISDSYFRSDFWYRDEFEARIDSECQFLHFEGINYQARVFLNSKPLGMIDGAFRQADFDVTGLLKEGTNLLEVKLIHNPSYGQVKEQTAFTPDNNGGILGADNPTMHATIGWDWIPTVRGRNIGIYDDVWLAFTGPVTVEEPFVRSVLPLPDTTSATLLAQAKVVNHAGKAVEGELKWSFGPLSASVPLHLAAGESRTVELEPQLLQNPHLWWPNGYGDPYLYPVSFSFETGAKVSDRKEFLSGVRQMEYKLEPYELKMGSNFQARNNNQRLSMYVNGRRFIGFGGNWGYSEHLLNYRDREFDAAVAYHADMNFTMIRNWVGMISQEAFYEACDRHGIMIWQDFWLANPWDGPDPRNHERFNEVADEYVRRIRNHPSVGLYVGRNEGYPPEDIDKHLEELVAREHPGLFYISHSAADGVSGGGPYRALAPSEYFRVRGREKMHSEMGMPNVMNYENMVRTMGDNLEPVNTLEHPNAMYGLHDYTLGKVANSAQQCDSFNELLAKAFGEPADAKTFSELAQWVNYDGYRAMFEGRGQYRHGLLLWMSHPAWPSMVWQTYDYYLEPTAAYFGCKKACEPLHIQLNQDSGQVEVVNYRGKDRQGLVARADILDMHGNVLYSQDCPLDLPEDETCRCFPLAVPDAIGPVYYVRLSLADASGGVLSTNFYVQGKEEGNFQALNQLGPARVEAGLLGANPWKVVLTNTGDVPALRVRLKLVDSENGDLVVPVLYSDNYLSLMPGESTEVEISAAPEDLRGKPVLKLSGFHLEELTVN